MHVAAQNAINSLFQFIIYELFWTFIIHCLDLDILSSTTTYKHRGRKKQRRGNNVKIIVVNRHQTENLETFTRRKFCRKRSCSIRHILITNTNNNNNQKSQLLLSSTTVQKLQPQQQQQQQQHHFHLLFPVVIHLFIQIIWRSLLLPLVTIEIMYFIQFMEVLILYLYDVYSLTFMFGIFIKLSFLNIRHLQLIFLHMVHSYYNKVIISICSSSTTDSSKSSTFIALLINTSMFNVPPISVNIAIETTTSQLYNLIDDYLNTFNINKSSCIIYCDGKAIFKQPQVKIYEHNIFPSQINEPYNIVVKRGGIAGGKPGETPKYLQQGALLLYKKRYTKPPTQYQPGWKKTINNNDNDNIITEFRLGEIVNFDTNKLSG